MSVTAIEANAIAREVVSAIVLNKHDVTVIGDIIAAAIEHLTVEDLLAVMMQQALIVEFVYTSWTSTTGRPHLPPTWDELMTHIAAAVQHG